jgi:hypothetical protein
MTTSRQKTKVDLTPETSCICNIPQTVDNVQHNIKRRRHGASSQ